MLLKEWLQSHTSFKAITKYFRNPQVEEIVVPFVTERNAWEWFIIRQHNAIKDRRNCQTFQNRWKTFWRIKKLVFPIHAISAKVHALALLFSSFLFHSLPSSTTLFLLPPCSSNMYIMERKEHLHKMRK